MQSMVGGEQGAMESVRADGGSTVVCCWSCGAVCVGATSESHCDVCSVDAGVMVVLL